MRATILLAVVLSATVATAQTPTTTFDELSQYLPEAPHGWEVEIVDESAAVGGVLASANYFNDEDFFTISLMADNSFVDFARKEAAPERTVIGDVEMGVQVTGELSGVFGPVAVTGRPGETSRELLLQTLETVDFDALENLGN